MTESPADAPASTVVAPDQVHSDGADAAEPTATKPAPAKSGLRNSIEWLLVIGGAVTVAVIIRALVFQSFWIPSPSMATTLVKDDRVLVNKLSYRLHDVNRGDVVVFHRPPSEAISEPQIKDLIKRVVGLSGERVSIRDGKVHIDGAVLEEPYTNGLETLDNGCSTGDLTQLYTDTGFLVPEGHVFVLGDNRINSGDGRCFGPIDEDLIVGRAFVKYWPPGHIGTL